MAIKKSLIFFFFIIFLLQFVLAQEYKFEISLIPQDKIFDAGETIKLKVTLYDSENNLIDDEVLIIFKDLRGIIIKEAIIKLNNLEEINLEGKAISGEGELIVKYKDSELKESFFIKENKLIKFELEGEKLIVTNIGNSIYEKKIYITIGDTTGTKTPKLNVGEKIFYRLIAPKGVYNFKATDGETTFTKGEVRLTGTGNVIGALDESASSRKGITGIAPDKNSEGELLGYLRNSQFVYVFIFVVFGAMILLAVEKKFKKNISKK